MRRELAVLVGVMAAGCGAPSLGAGSSTAKAQAAIIICPAGSILDPQKQLCVAIEPAQPIDVDEGSDVAAPTSRISPITSASASVPPPPPPPTSGFAVDVRCAFTQGWVALIPASRYPKDDQFLMQSLVGLTKEPSFWMGLPEYRVFQPFAAKRCSQASSTRLLAPSAGDYYLVAAQEGTFSLRGSYDKNGVRRKVTVNTNQSVTLGPVDLTFTWVCVSCPWIVFRSADGRDLPPFVVLADRRGVAARGSGTHWARHVPVVAGRVTLRVMEVEQEDTHLEALTLRVAGHVLTPESRARLELGPHTQATVSYRVEGGPSSGFVDVEVEATGYYDPR